MFIDTHCHLNFKNFENDHDEVIRRCLENDTWLIVVGTDHKTSKKALELANKYQTGVYASIGLHPVHLSPDLAKGEDYKFNPRVEKFSQDVYEKLAKFENVVAVGEIGLDYYHIDKNKNIERAKKLQKEVFLAQLKIARKQNLPVIIHCRQAHDDMIEILAKFKKEHRDLFPSNENWGVVHCFGESEDIAWKYFSLDLMISFTGIITFSKQLDDLIRRLPSAKFMIETDAPYLTPEPFRGKRNDPMLVKNIAERIGEIKNLSLERIAEITTENARRLFKI